MPEHHEISRRRVVTGAAWAAPVIVVASAAPAVAGSATPPNVTTVVEPAVHSGTTLPVTVRFQNSGTQSTGVTVIDVFFTTNLAAASGEVSDAAPVIDETASSAGWTYDAVRGTVQRRIFTFTRALGIEGATGPTPAETVLAFSITVVPAEPLDTSAGSISVFFDVVTNGDRPDNGVGAWT
jgi:hypothetical protein